MGVTGFLVCFPLVSSSLTASVNPTASIKNGEKISIQVYEQDKRFVLETANTEYQMKVTEVGILQHLYYGKKTYG